MRQIKHSKYKNTGILFELLVRQTTSDVLSNNNSKALDLAKKYFGKNMTLNKELQLYKEIMDTQFLSKDASDKAKSLIDEVIFARKKLDNSKLRKEKYNL